MTCCAEHPDRPVEGSCSRCLRLLCAGCLVPFQGVEACAACKQEAVRELGTRSALRADRVVRAAFLYDALLGLAALAAIGLEWTLMQFTPSGGLGIFTTGTAPVTLFEWARERAGLVIIIEMISLLLALLAALLLGLRRPSGHTAQLLSAAVSPVLATVWAGALSFPVWVGAAFLLYFWTRPPVREYCQQRAL